MARLFDDGPGNFSGVQRSVGTNIDAFFNKFGKNVSAIAHDQVARMAESMLYALKHRQRLKGGNGQYPKWDSPDSPSKNSYRYWYKELQGRHKWVIRNNATDPATGYNYPNALISGKGWSRKVRTAVVKQGGQTERLILNSGGIFSKQLPNGLNPWLRIKRKELKRNIQKALR